MPDSMAFLLMPELVARIRLQVKRFRFHEYLRNQHKENRANATRDPLTSLLNRRGLESALHTPLAQAARLRLPTSAIMVDIDSFQELNDNFGHAMGDDLARIAEFHARGARYMSIAHNRHSQLGDSHTPDEPLHGGRLAAIAAGRHLGCACSPCDP